MNIHFLIEFINPIKLVLLGKLSVNIHQLNGNAVYQMKDVFLMLDADVERENNISRSSERKGLVHQAFCHLYCIVDELTFSVSRLVFLQ